ncbi:hypothetical protein [Aeromonas diversa]|uniref:hypothetical protein n=1 Tax=Aeromonas diversa TaxID=502790 RepID=UPI00346287EC
MWEILSKHFKNPSALAEALGISPQAVFNALRKKKIPSTWVRKLIKHGVCQSDLEKLPVNDRASNQE